MDSDSSGKAASDADDAVRPFGTEGSVASTPESSPSPPPSPWSPAGQAEASGRVAPVPPSPPSPPAPGLPWPLPRQSVVAPSAAPSLVPKPVKRTQSSSAWLRGVFVLFTGCMLFVGGFIAGQLWPANNLVGVLSPSANVDSQDGVDVRGVSSVNSEPTAEVVDSLLEVQPSPLPQLDACPLEPVVDVANVVSPSVVVIRSDEGQGSGVVWDAEKGYIVTNNHVVERSTNVDVEFPNGQAMIGTVIGGDSSRDLAVVGVDPDEVNSLVQAVFAPTSEVRVGQLAVAIGGPFGLDQSVTAGVVSAINRVLLEGGSDPDNPSPIEMVQTDAPINPGNSGGALADRQGRVIGINTQIRTTGPSVGNIGVGFAIPSDTVVLIARRIVTGESLDLGFLGIQGYTPTDGSLGAVVTSVVEGSPANVSGIKAGDLIMAVNGKPVLSMADLAAEIKLFRPGEAVDVLLLRDGIRLTVQAILSVA